MGLNGLRNPDDGPKIPADEVRIYGPPEIEGWYGRALLAGEANDELAVCSDPEVEDEVELENVDDKDEDDVGLASPDDSEDDKEGEMGLENCDELEDEDVDEPTTEDVFEKRPAVDEVERLL